MSLGLRICALVLLSQILCGLGADSVSPTSDIRMQRIHVSSIPDATATPRNATANHGVYEPWTKQLAGTLIPNDTNADLSSSSGFAPLPTARSGDHIERSSPMCNGSLPNGNSGKVLCIRDPPQSVKNDAELHHDIINSANDVTDADTQQYRCFAGSLRRSSCAPPSYVSRAVRAALRQTRLLLSSGGGTRRSSESDMMQGTLATVFVSQINQHLDTIEGYRANLLALLQQQVVRNTK